MQAVEGILHQPRLAADIALGPIQLQVSDMERSVGFYERAIGLRRRGDSSGAVLLGTGQRDLIELVERPDARAAGRHAGIYHFALLLPDRSELARSLRRLAQDGTPVTGAADHLVSEALYLADPDGIGIELYADRPRSGWQWRDGRLSMDTLPLDIAGLLRDGAPDGAAAAETAAATTMGHMHLHVPQLGSSVTFWRDVVGLDLTTSFGASAAFLSSGGYHHHLAVNVWRGEGIPAAPSDAVGLRWWTIGLPAQHDLDQLRQRLSAAGYEVDHVDGQTIAVEDPAGVEVRFSVGA